MSLWIPATTCAIPVMGHGILTVTSASEMRISIVETFVYVTCIGQETNVRSSLALVTLFAKPAMVQVHSIALLV